jgi:uncharacterized protein YajQ (UPF0234 family)
VFSCAASVEASQEDKKTNADSENEEYLTHLVDIPKRTIAWRFINAALLKKKKNQPIALISQQKCKTYSGENGNQTF